MLDENQRCEETGLYMEQCEFCLEVVLSLDVYEDSYGTVVCRKCLDRVGHKTVRDYGVVRKVAARHGTKI